MSFAAIHLDSDIHVEEIYTVHYFEYRNDFHFPGERHDFWEFQCVDKGMAQVCTDDGPHILNRGQAIFHKPNEFHDLMAVGNTAPNIVVVSFTCHSPCMKFFENRIVNITDTERNLLGMLISEARRCISSPLDDPYLNIMEKRENALFGSQQLLRLYLEQILIYLIRRNMMPQLSVPISKFVDLKTNSAPYNKILFYLEEHIRESLTIEDICHDNLIGRSQLQKLFREQSHCGVIELFSQMKIEFAKQLIRENEMNFTQISEFLGYSSIHYFSRQFKKIAGMTPSEYASSIMALSEKHR
ncbi:MAG: AraC family transcriptional regulator [Blautia sp.]|nr:AraC family transcriptional regulator [Blautia sp.]MDD7728329.1 AraC family transcriptional regulator [Clostridia bacterium]MDY5664072.1 AraC family transcriptional regulator [Blautia sp.]